MYRITKVASLNLQYLDYDWAKCHAILTLIFWRLVLPKTKAAWHWRHNLCVSPGTPWPMCYIIKGSHRCRCRRCVQKSRDDGEGKIYGGGSKGRGRGVGREGWVEMRRQVYGCHPPDLQALWWWWWWWWWGVIPPIGRHQAIIYSIIYYLYFYLIYYLPFYLLLILFSTIYYFNYYLFYYLFSYLLFISRRRRGGKGGVAREKVGGAGVGEGLFV